MKVKDLLKDLGAMDPDAEVALNVRSKAMVILTVRVTDALRARLNLALAKSGLSINAWCTQAIEEKLARSK